jgi:hydroxymethylglutaryl-CoA reductase (NADPH)
MWMFLSGLRLWLRQIATNKVALIAGVQRGIKAINLSGGINTIEAPNIMKAREFIDEIKTNRKLMADLVTFVKDPYVRLESIDPYQMGSKVFLRMIFKTGDAMGMNGVTKASADITRAMLTWLEGWRLLTISSNLCTDKKSAHINILNGRGKSIQTEVFIHEEVLQKVFKKGTTSKSVEKLVHRQL